jgi:tyrosyl-tRNA synthetase
MALAALRSRGLLSAVTSEALADVCAGAQMSGHRPSVYAGFDPTAPSLHLGNMVSLMSLRHFQAHGFRPILLVRIHSMLDLHSAHNFVSVV